MLERARVCALVAVLLLVSIVACDGPGADAPRRELPPYTGRATELFDDAIEPRALGFELEQPTTPKADPVLRERTQVGDAVLRVRVATVTAKQEESGASYQVSFRIVDRVTGANPPPDGFTVRVERSSPAAGILRGLESRLVGKPFIAFVRAFSQKGGDPEIHFHLSPDTKETLAAVVEASTLNELK